MIAPYYAGEARQYHTREWATPEMMRAAVSNYWDMGVDGMYTYFLKWPIDDAGRTILTEMGDPGLVKDKTKHYLVRRRTDTSDTVGYDLPLPVEIAHDDTGTSHEMDFYVSDDVEGDADRIREVRLKILIADLLAYDRLTIRLNGESLGKTRSAAATTGASSTPTGDSGWSSFSKVLGRAKAKTSSPSPSTKERRVWSALS